MWLGLALALGLGPELGLGLGLPRLPDGEGELIELLPLELAPVSVAVDLATDFAPLVEDEPFKPAALERDPEEVACAGEEVLTRLLDPEVRLPVSEDKSPLT